jgi:hypothetical protein
MMISIRENHLSTKHTNYLEVFSLSPPWERVGKRDLQNLWKISGAAHPIEKSA